MKYRGTIGSDYSGKLGGVVASRNTYGSYFRRLVKPVNPKTPAQQVQRLAFGSSSQSWRTLTSSQQAAWITAAPSLPVLGKNGSVILTGQALFMYCNTLLVKAGLPIITTPPTSTTAPDFTTPDIQLNGSGAGSITFNADPWNAPGGAVDCSISATITAGRNYVGTYYGLAIIAFPSIATEIIQSGSTYPDGANVQMAFVAETPDGRKTQQIIVPVTVANVPVVSVVHGAAGAAIVNVSSGIFVQAGQTVVFDTTAGYALTAKSTGIFTAIPINEAVVVADSIDVSSPAPGITASSTPVIAT